MLAEAVPPSGCVVLNANDDMSPAIAAALRAGVVTGGTVGGRGAAPRSVRVRASILSLILRSRRLSAVRSPCPCPGRHMIHNAVLAAARRLPLGLAPIGD